MSLRGDYKVIGESTSTPNQNSTEPMLGAEIPKLKFVRRRPNRAWTILIVIISVSVIALIVGAGILLWKFRSPDPTYKPHQVTSKDEFSMRFEYELDKKKEELLVNLKMNFTEIVSQDLTVYNYFSKRLSISKVDLTPGLQACLVKPLSKEIEPDQLMEALPHLSQIEINKTELYTVSDTLPPAAVLEDIRINQICNSAKIYMLHPATEENINTSLSMDDIIKNSKSLIHKMVKRDFRPSNPLDNHNSPPYHCGGPIGLRELPLSTLKYSCTKSKTYCYRKLVNERCEECYHGHYLRTRGCWCPITAIESCIRISWLPDTRYCCHVDEAPCVKNECESHRIQAVPIPVITFKVIPNDFS